MTTERSSKNGAITLSRINFSGYVGHETIFTRMLATACCLAVRLGLRLGLDLVTVCLVVIHSRFRKCDKFVLNIHV